MPCESASGRRPLTRCGPTWAHGLTLTGRWDGQFLSLQDPAARVALAPRPAAPPGELVVSGVLVRPEGRRVPGGFDYRFWLREQ
ncbi:MAG: hypothetical protein ACR2J4_10240, partial [Deinococcus sp.]